MRLRGLIGTAAAAACLAGPLMISAAAVVLAAVALAATVSATAAATASAATSDGGCTARSGTIVAVDFSHWGGPIVRGCALRRRAGYGLLRAAGFTTAGDEHDGPAFICRLGDAAFRDGRQYPTSGQDGCVRTPSASGYWSYWLAPAGARRWSYSQVGAMSDVPKPGEVELWTFGATNVSGTQGSGVPRFTPAQVRDSTTGSTLGSAGPRVLDARLTAAHTSSGSAAPLVIGVGVALALCAGAGWAAWRRRRYE